ATIEGRPALRFRDGPWYWAVLASLLTAMGCFFVMGATIEAHKGDYIPPRIEGDRVIPGRINE
ncbi:MAG: hypothetical protein SFW64_07455, partial [Alphaproteobacteria bacterium]|nr:hypothetical protein [Alphaproteobacteria bacterium]